MKNLIYLSLMLLVATACTKGGGNIYFSGRVYNPITNEGIPNVRIRLMKESATGGDILSGSVKEVTKVTTNSNGEFEIIETISGSGKNYYYDVIYDDDRYQLLSWENHGGITRSITKGEDDYDNLKMVGFGRMSTHIKNVNCIDENDRMNGHWTYSLTGQSTANNYFNLGCFDQIHLSSQPRAAGDYRFDWYVIRNGVRTDSTKTVTVHENDTTHVELFY